MQFCFMDFCVNGYIAGWDLFFISKSLNMLKWYKRGSDLLFVMVVTEEILLPSHAK